VSVYQRSYAQAFLGAAPAGYDLERFLESARALSRAITEDPRLKPFFLSPAVPAPAKKAALAALAGKAGVDGFGLRLLELILERGRILALSGILDAVRTQFDHDSGVVAARVTVAAPVGEEERRRIAEALGSKLNRKVRLDVGVDEKILGGFVAQVGSEVLDASVRHAIERFQKQTKELAETAGA